MEEVDFGLGAHRSSLNLTFPVKSIRVSGSDSWRFLQLSWNDIELLTFLTSSHCSIPRGSGPKCEAKNWTFTKTDNLKSQNFNYLEAEQPCQTFARPGSFHCWIPAPGHLLVCIAHLVQDDNEDPHWKHPSASRPSPSCKNIPHPNLPSPQQVAGMYWQLRPIDSHTNNRQSHTQLSPLLFASFLNLIHL